MADYVVSDTSLTGVANAIRTKGGTSSPLVFPSGFESAIAAIPTGGGGGSSWNPIYSSVLTGVSTTSTNAIDIATIQLGSGAFTSDAILWIHIRDMAGPRSGYFYGTDSICVNASAYGGADTSFSYMAYQTLRYNNRFYCYAQRYGVYPTSIDSNGELIVRARYNTTYSLTINGDYSISVYKLTPPSSNWLFG